LLAAFITSEVVLNGLEDNEDVLLVTLDAEKAFDKLNHEILFKEMYHYGIVGDTWILLRNMYRKMNIQVKWEGELSDKIYIYNKAYSRVPNCQHSYINATTTLF
jgi:hypothetical protein